jgi:hypothetical protein
MARNRKNTAPTSAPSQTETERSPTTSHNANARRDILREVNASLDACEAEIAAIRERMVGERARVKALDIRMADFNAVRRLRRLEDDDRRKALDGLHESFAALMPGEQLDWLTATSTIEVRSGDNGAEHPDSKLARAAGREAGRGGKSATINPHAPGSDQHEQWRIGWMEGTRENAPKRTDDPFAADAAP